MIHVPYKGASPVLTDAIAGHIEVIFIGMASALPHVKSGRLRALAVTSIRRVAAAPDVPTIDEQGLAGFETTSWFGVAVPAGTPRDIVAKLHAGIVRVIALPEVRGPLAAEGADFVGDTPEQFTAFPRADIERWGKAIKASGARPE